MESDEITPYLDVAHPDHTQLGFAFNKQGTHVIIRGIDCRQKKHTSLSDSDELYVENKDYMPHHVIIPVTINEAKKQDGKKGLLFFLANQMIQNILPNSAKQKCE